MKSFAKKSNTAMSAWDVDAKSWRHIASTPTRRNLRKRLSKMARSKLKRDFEKNFAEKY